MDEDAAGQAWINVPSSVVVVVVVVVEVEVEVAVGLLAFGQLVGYSSEGGENAKEEEVCTLAVVAIAARNWTSKLDAFDSPAAFDVGVVLAAVVAVALSSSFCLK